MGVDSPVSVAVTMVIGVITVGTFIFKLISDNRHKKRLEQEIENMQSDIIKIRQELVSHRESEAKNDIKICLRDSKSRTSSFSSCRSEGFTDDMLSVGNTDEEEKYYDLNSDDDSLVEALNVKYYQDRIVSKLFDQVDLLMKGNDNDRLKAFHLLKRQEYKLGEHSNFLWRLAKACQYQALYCEYQKDKDRKKKYVIEGLEYATKALALDLTNANAHKWYAILTGMEVEFLPLKDRIKNVCIFHKHILNALEYDSRDFSLYHVLGRFKFEISNVSWVKKKLLSTLLSEIPSCSYADAISDLLLAEELNPSPWKENRLLLGKCYFGNSQYDQAIRWLNSAREITSKTKEDEVFDEEIEVLLNECQQHKK